MVYSCLLPVCNFYSLLLYTFLAHSEHGINTHFCLCNLSSYSDFLIQIKLINSIVILAKCLKRSEDLKRTSKGAKKSSKQIRRKQRRIPHAPHIQHQGCAMLVEDGSQRSSTGPLRKSSWGFRTLRMGLMKLMCVYRRDGGGWRWSLKRCVLQLVNSKSFLKVVNLNSRLKVVSSPYTWHFTTSQSTLKLAKSPEHTTPWCWWSACPKSSQYPSPFTVLCFVAAETGCVPCHHVRLAHDASYYDLLKLPPTVCSRACLVYNGRRL